VKAYIALMKLRVVELLLVTTVPALFLASGGVPDLAITVATLFGGTLAAGAANAFNMVIESDIDQVMGRTSARPLVREQMSEAAALTFAFAITVISLLTFWVFTNPLATGLTVAAIAFYVFGYTVGLKRRTSQNIVWGGIAGCMPVLIGWAAVTGTLSLTAWLFFLLIFFWTPPHFWALAIKYKDDYQRAGVPMLPVVAPMRSVVVSLHCHGDNKLCPSCISWCRTLDLPSCNLHQHILSDFSSSDARGFFAVRVCRTESLQGVNHLPHTLLNTSCPSCTRLRIFATAR
jgi:protoheme IX farnesyltransferase